MRMKCRPSRLVHTEVIQVLVPDADGCLPRMVATPHFEGRLQEADRSGGISDCCSGLSSRVSIVTPLRSRIRVPCSRCSVGKPLSSGTLCSLHAQRETDAFAIGVHVSDRILHRCLWRATKHGEHGHPGQGLPDDPVRNAHPR